MTSKVLSATTPPLRIDADQLETLYQTLLRNDRRPGYSFPYPTLSVKLGEKSYDAHATFLVGSESYRDIIELCICTDAIRPSYLAFSVIRRPGSGQWEIGHESAAFDSHKWWTGLDDSDRLKELALD